MTKARILLGAITILAVAGGALAFKPVKFTDRNVYCPIHEIAPNKCPLQNFSKDDVGAGTSTFRCADPDTQVNLGFVYTATTIVGSNTICVTTATTNVVYNTIEQ